MSKAQNNQETVNQFDLIANADKSQGVELSTEYFQFEKLGEYVFKFHGMTTAKMQSKVVDVVMIETKEGKHYLNANAVLVNSCSRIKDAPCMIKVIYKGKEQSEKGEYASLDVIHFPSKLNAANANGKV